MSSGSTPFRLQPSTDSFPYVPYEYDDGDECFSLGRRRRLVVDLDEESPPSSPTLLRLSRYPSSLARQSRLQTKSVYRRSSASLAAPLRLKRAGAAPASSSSTEAVILGPPAEENPPPRRRHLYPLSYSPVPAPVPTARTVSPVASSISPLPTVLGAPSAYTRIARSAPKPPVVKTPPTILNRDENGADTDGTEWCHICFHIFLRKQIRIQKPWKQKQKQILTKTDTDRIRRGHGTMQILDGTKRTIESCKKNVKNASKPTKLFAILARCPIYYGIGKCQTLESSSNA